MVFNVVMIYDKGPDRLTPDEAERLACVLYLDHDHDAKTPQVPRYWFRVGEHKV